MIVAVLILGSLAWALARSGWLVAGAVLGGFAGLVALFGLAQSMGAGFYSSHHPEE